MSTPGKVLLVFVFLASLGFLYVGARVVKTQPAEFVPSCTQLASLRGDPAKEAAHIFARADSNCVIPWHWHTPIEEVMMISGRARVDMRNGGKETLIAGTLLGTAS